MIDTRIFGTRRDLNPRVCSPVQGNVARVIWRISCYVACQLLVFGSLSSISQAQPETARIVGLGATDCARFSSDAKSNPLVRRDYMAWAQGFMSGILLGRPAGVDKGLDLNPATFGLIDQLHFLEDHCARNPSLDFSDAVAALYKWLRQERKT